MKETCVVDVVTPLMLLLLEAMLTGCEQRMGVPSTSRTRLSPETSSAAA